MSPRQLRRTRWAVRAAFGAMRGTRAALLRNFTLSAFFACVAVAAHEYLAAACASLLAVVAVTLASEDVGQRRGYELGCTDGTRHAAEAARKRAADIDHLIAGSGAVIRGQGYLYIVGFSTGAIKVGQTVEPRKRLRDHRRDALAFGVYVVDLWVSEAHANYLANEVALLRLCLTIGPCAKQEYFHTVGFERAVELTKRLAYQGVPA